MSGRFCPYCAAPAEADWVFCQACAKPLPGSERTPEDERLSALWKRSSRQLEDGDLQGADVTVSQLMDLGCASADLSALQGAIALRRVQLNDAIDFLDRAVREAPDSPYVRLKRVEYWLAIGMANRAVEEVEAAIKAAESDAVRARLKAVLQKLKRDSRWNFARASPTFRNRSKTE